MDLKLLQLVYDNVFNGIYITDGQGVTVSVNKTFEEMSGISREDIIGKSLQYLVHEANLFSGSASLLVLEKKTPITVTYNTKTGKKLLVKGRPIFDKNGVIQYVINTIWDLTDIQYKHKIDSDTARDSVLVDNDIVSCSPQMLLTIDLCMRMANTRSTILLTGESGVGKSLLAGLIHQAGTVKDKPLVKINCATIPENLIETELFGYHRGAFTGAAEKGKKGLFDIANKGTIFLDEISELPLYTQSKLLGVLQDKEFMAVGALQPKKVDVRIITATNKNLWTMVKDGIFREDLYHRLNVVPINVPPLRQRPEDIGPLTSLFLEKFNTRNGSYKKISDGLVQQFEKLTWPGNVRELENVVERLVVTSKNDTIVKKDFQTVACHAAANDNMSLKARMEQCEKEVFQQLSCICRSTREMARMLETSQPTIVRKLRKYNISLSR